MLEKLFKILCPDVWHFDCLTCKQHVTFDANNYQQARKKAMKKHNKNCINCEGYLLKIYKL